jgi:hypothetical protein
MRPTETPLPLSELPSAPVSVFNASSPRVAWLEVVPRSLIGWLPSRYVTPGCVPAFWICAFVPRATTTSMRLNVIVFFRPLLCTAALAADRLEPCTSTVVTPLLLSLPS